MEKRLIETIDCTTECISDRYFSSHPTSIKESSAGIYREAASEPLARFGYKFTVNDLSKPHLLVIYIPDDKRRNMTIADGIGYDLNTGVLTGGAQPITGNMLKLEYVFWSRLPEWSIVFMTYGRNEPAAVSKVEIYELDSLPEGRKPVELSGLQMREIGTQYEDPCGNLGCEGAMDMETWVDRAVSYLSSTGQNLLVYPLSWYHGPMFPSQNEPSDGLGIKIDSDRLVYGRYTTQPDDWYKNLLTKLGDKGIGFVGSLTLMRLGSLMAQMNLDEESVKGGADTINNVLSDGQVQPGTMDWTPIYNAMNYPAILEKGKGEDGTRPFIEGHAFAYGEKTGATSSCPSGPIFNPLHPKVQEAIIRFAREIAARYGSYGAFRGIAFNMYKTCMPWFGSLKSGYDDYTVGKFEEETGITVPVEKTDPERFSKRYEYLTQVCRKAWIDWRCLRIRDLIRAVRDAMHQERADLTVNVTLWQETFMPQTLGGPSPATQLFARDYAKNLYAEAGIDIDLFADENCIEVGMEMGNSRDRGGHGADPNIGSEAPLYQRTPYRDQDYLDAVTLRSLESVKDASTFLFDCWVEVWGDHRWCNIEGDPRFKQTSTGGTFLMKTIREDDGYWWKPGLMITPHFFLGDHYLEPFAHAVAEFDAMRIARGGLFLDRAHGDLMRKFSAGFSVLPKVPFETVGTSTDPVAVRQKVVDGKLYFYAVNREYYPVEVNIQLSGVGKVKDLISGEVIDSSELKLMLGAYEIRSFSSDDSIVITECSAIAPNNISSALVSEAEAALNSIAEVRELGNDVPGMDEIAVGLQDAIATKRYAWIRRAVGGYVVNKCREVASSAS